MIKKVFAILGCSLAFVVFSGAQAPFGGPATSGPQMKDHRKGWVREKEILAKLDLNSGQKDKLKSVLLMLKKSSEDLKRQENSFNKDELKEKRKALKKSYVENLKVILTPAQFIQYREIHKELRKKAEEAKSGAAVPRPF